MLAAAPPPDAAGAPDTLGDQAYIEHLARLDASSAATDAQVGRRRLSKLFFSLASTLAGGRTNVRLLQSAMDLRDPASDSTRAVVAARYEAYARAVDGFRVSVSSLIDAPSSTRALYRALMDGHRACGLLDAFARLTETYGAKPADLVAAIASSEACRSFRRAAFAPAVERIVERDLEEVETLREELAELERLLDDLREIDSR